MPAAWKTVRVFISSTFRDMHGERDHLVKVVFPTLRERLEKYRIHLVDIDLRWGITEEESQHDRVLDLCLQQIDECRPFFVGILGERYGWVPSSFSEEAASKYGWVQHHTGRSVTELEILYGVLNDPQMRSRAFFFFRDPAFVRDLDAQHQQIFCEGPTKEELETLSPDGAQARAEDRRRKLADLKERIRRSACRVMDGYPARWDSQAFDRPTRTSGRLVGLEEFGRRVQENLWEAIKAQEGLPEAPPVVALAEQDPLAEEAAFHEAFMESRLRVYVGREKIQKDLTEFADGDATLPCLVTGPSGSGKSAAMARFVRGYADSHRDVLVIPHFVGASPGSTSLRHMLRRFCLVLQRRFNQAEEVPQDVNGLISRFRKSLEGVPADARVVLVIDALNQLDETDNAHSLYWLPRQFPPQVKVIVSCIDDTPKGQEPLEPVLQAFAHRRPPRLRIKPLSADERFEIVNQVPSMSAKKLSPKQIGLLLSNPATTNPLFLLVALEELRGFGSFEQLEARIAAFPCEGDTVTAVFDQVIERLREEFDGDVVRTVLALLACSRRGMSERELYEMVEGMGAEEPNSDVYPVLRQLRPYLQHRGELLDFFHRGLFKAVRQRYVPDAERAKPYHGELADYFHAKGFWVDSQVKQGTAGQSLSPAARTANPRTVDELPWQRLYAEEWNELERLLSDLEFIEAKCTAGMAHDLLADYGRFLGEAGQSELPVRTARFDGRRHGVHCPFCLGWHEIALEKLGHVLSCPTCARSFRVNPFAIQSWWGPSPPRKGRDASSKSSLSDRPRSVAEFEAFVRSELHVFRKYPQLVFQQSHNCPDASAPHIAACSLLKSGIERRPWLRWINKPAQTPPDRMTISESAGNAFACSPDGTRIVCVGSRVELWDSSSGQSVWVTEEHTTAYTSCAFSPDGEMIATGAEDGAVRLWDASSGTERGVFRGHVSAVRGCDFSPDGAMLASCSDDRTVRLWDLRSRTQLATLTGHTLKVVACQFSPQGTWLVSASYDSDLHLRSVEDPSQRVTLSGHSSSVQACDFSPDGKRVVSASHDKTVRVWDAERGVELACLRGHKNYLACCSFSPDGKYIVSGSVDGSLRLWEVEQDRAVAIFAYQLEPLRACSFTPGGNRIAALTTRGVLTLIDAAWRATGPTRIRRHGQVTACAFSPNGKAMVSVGEDEAMSGTVTLWDTQTGSQVKAHTGLPGMATCCAFSPDGKRIAVGLCGMPPSGGGLRLFEGVTGSEIGAIPGYDVGVHSCAFSPDGTRLASGDSGKAVLWDAATLTPIGTHRFNHLAPWNIEICAFSPDGTRLVLADWVQTGTGELRLCDAKTAKLVSILASIPDRMIACAFAPNGRTVLAGDANYARSDQPGWLGMWDTRQGTPITVLVGHKLGINACAFSPDGNRVASACEDGTLRLWEVAISSGSATGRDLTDLEGVWPASFSPDGNRIAYAISDELLVVSEVPSGRRLCTHYAGKGIRAVAWSPDGRALAAGDAGGGTYLLHLENMDSQPPVVTPWCQTHSESAGVGCPFCRSWFELPRTPSAPQVWCPSCGNTLTLAESPIFGDWHALAGAWCRPAG